MAVFASEVRRLSAPLSEGLRVRHIAHFGLHTCDERDEPAEVLNRDDLADFRPDPHHQRLRDAKTSLPLGC